MSSDRAGRPVAVTIAATMVRAIIMVFSATLFLCMVPPQNHAQVKGQLHALYFPKLERKANIYITYGLQSQYFSQLFRKICKF